MRPPFSSSLRALHVLVSRGLILLAGWLPGFLTAAESAALQDVVRLPEFKVFDTRPLPPREAWDYVRIGNIEILSNASAATTQRFARDLMRFQNMLQVVAPTMLIRAEHPVMIVLCGKDGQYARFVQGGGEARRVKNVSFVRDVEIASIVVDYEQRSVGAPDRVGISVANNGPNGLSPVPPTLATGSTPAQTMAEFSRQYVLLSLSEMKPRLPAWAAEGLASVYSAIEYADKWIEIGSPRLFQRQAEEVLVTADIAPEITALRNRAGQGGFQSSSEYGSGVINASTVYAIERPLAILPLSQLLAVGYDSTRQGGTAPNTFSADYQWRQQCAAFVHLCLYGANGKYRKAFIDFAARTSIEPATEALFKECFGIDYRAMELKIRTHWTDGVFKGSVIESKEGGLVGKGEAPPPRPATDAEIGRIKGETYRLTGQEEAARQEFVTAYLRGERDLQLLASLGLMARQRRDESRARTYLEAVGAAEASVPRPRAYLELSRLRAEAMRTGATPPRYDAAALVSLLTPLFRAQKLPQQLSFIYREIATVWAHSAVPPDRDHLAAIEHGAQLFPYDPELAADLAELLVARGYAPEAQPYVARGLRIAREPALRERLLKLRTGS